MRAVLFILSLYLFNILPMFLYYLFAVFVLRIEEKETKLRLRKIIFKFYLVSPFIIGFIFLLFKFFTSEEVSSIKKIFLYMFLTN